MSLEYQRLSPTGSAYLSLTRPEHVPENLRVLDNQRISGKQISAFPIASIPAANSKDFLDGNGLSKDFSNDGKNVTIWGLPGKTPTDQIYYLLHDFPGAQPYEHNVTKLNQYVVSSPIFRTRTEQ